MSRVYVVPTTQDVPETDQDAARRMIARRVTDPTECAHLEEMLGLTHGGAR